MYTRKIRKRLLTKISAIGLALATTVNVIVPASVRANEINPGNKGINQQATAPKNNVVFIVLDDLGFADLGAYGSEIKTPNIDKLAADGLLYNNFNVCPVCSPTRASLLTGRDNHAVGMGNVSNVDAGPAMPTMRGRITSEAATVAQMLKDKGFSTMAVGKWHVAPMHQATPAGPFDYWPLGKGFERYYGFLEGEDNQYVPQLIYDNHAVDVPNKPGYHFSEDMVEHAMQFVTDQVSVTPDKPFFLYVAFGASHSPQQVPRKYINTYKGAYDQGWDKIRQERFERQKKLGVIPNNAELTPGDPAVKSWDSLSAAEKRLYARFMETYAGFITHADDQVGRLVEHLKVTGQYDNTMIVLISDNGATNSGDESGTDSFVNWMNGVKTTAKDLIPRIDEIGSANMEALYPAGWGMVGNTPFKQYKGSVYAGGTRDPLIIHWPQGIQGKSEVRDQYVHITDITPTVLDVMDIEAPKVFQGIEQMPMHGVSMANTLNAPMADSKHTTQFYMFDNQRSIYHEGWKAIAVHKNNTAFEQDKWELYHVAIDYSEANDVANQYPEKLQELQAMWSTEAAKYGVPLKEVGRAVMGMIPSGTVVDRNNFKYYPGMGPLGSMAAPRIANRSYTITVPVNRPDQSSKGVLVALGDHTSGFTMYVNDNRLVYEYNHFGTLYKVVSNKNVPVGESNLKLDFVKTGLFAGTANLYINDEKVGEVAIPQTFRAILSFEGLDVGRDRFSPVSKVYQSQGEFPFTGQFKYVMFDLKNDMGGGPRPH